MVYLEQVKRKENSFKHKQVCKKLVDTEYGVCYNTYITKGRGK